VFQPAEEVAGGAKAMVKDGLRDRIPKPDVAFAQHVLAYPAGTVGTQVGPVLSAGDSIRITLQGKGAHGSMPHNSVDPVVLAALVVLRLQTIVSRETKPGEFAVLTVGSSVAGAKSNIIPEHAVLLANLRTYDLSVRKRMIESIERMVNAECEASGAPKPPEFHYYDQYPLTDNDPDATKRTTAAFRSHFPSGTLFDLGHQTASEDFSDIPNALGTPYTYWGIGGISADKYARARGRAGGTGHPRQSFGVLRAGHRADAVHGHTGSGDRCVGVSGEVTPATVRDRVAVRLCSSARFAWG